MSMLDVSNLLTCVHQKHKIRYFFYVFLACRFQSRLDVQVKSGVEEDEEELPSICEAADGLATLGSMLGGSLYGSVCEVVVLAGRRALPSRQKKSQESTRTPASSTSVYSLERKRAFMEEDDDDA